MDDRRMLRRVHPLAVLVGAASIALLCGMATRRPRHQPPPTFNFYDPDAL